MSDDLKGELRLICDMLTDIKERIGKIEECINGNGKAGIKDRVTRIETWGTAISFILGLGLSFLGLFKK